jgi:hypothetical protein
LSQRATHDTITQNKQQNSLATQHSPKTLHCLSAERDDERKRKQSNLTITAAARKSHATVDSKRQPSDLTNFALLTIISHLFFFVFTLTVGENCFSSRHFGVNDELECERMCAKLFILFLTIDEIFFFGLVC